MKSLLEDFQYGISRTPGQPALDLMNMVAFAFGGKAGLIGTYLVVCLLGIAAFYRICLIHGVRHPFLCATCLLLSPHFVAHVTGLGDFSLSLSLFLICLYLLTCRKYNLAALVYVAAIGCRLSYCLFVFPLMYYIYNVDRNTGESMPYYHALRFAAISAAGSLCLFSPLFAVYGVSLFRNLGWQSFSYHVSSSIYKLISRGLGLPLSLLVVLLIVVRPFRSLRYPSSAENRFLDTFLLMTMLVTFTIFFFVPTKSEILLPLLAGLLLYVGRRYPLSVLTCTLVSIVFLGIVYVDLRDPSDDSLALRFANGFYFQAYSNAHENRKGGEEIKQAMANLSAHAVLIANYKAFDHVGKRSYRFLANRTRDALDDRTDSTLRLLGNVIRFPGIDARFVADFQDDGLKDFLQTNSLLAEGLRYQIFYDPRYLSMIRRWQKIDPSHYGVPVKIDRSEFRLLPQDGLILLRFPNFSNWFRGFPRGESGRAVKVPASFSRLSSSLGPTHSFI
jgi:MFS family permease